MNKLVCPFHYSGRSDRQSDKLLNIAKATLNEIETPLIIAKKLEFSSDINLVNEIFFLIEQESQMMNVFYKNLK